MDTPGTQEITDMRQAGSAVIYPASVCRILLRQRGRVLWLTRMLVFDPKIAVAGIDPSKPDHSHRAIKFQET
jgi:hypothetical protein